MDNRDFQQPDPMLGSPKHDAEFFDGQQSLDDSCAIRCQEYILQMFHGVDYDEQDLVAEATAHGWYTPGGGTSIGDLGKLLELHGVAVNRFSNASVFHLSNELAQGHKVIIAVDSGELWGTDSLPDSERSDGADHAIVVSGIDTSDPGDIHVLVSDPGTGSEAARYPLAQFLSAWEDGNFTMVATQDAAPFSAPGMENFPFETGHLPYVLDVPYDEFAAYEPNPSNWTSWLQNHYDIHWQSLSASREVDPIDNSDRCQEQQSPEGGSPSFTFDPLPPQTEHPASETTLDDRTFEPSLHSQEFAQADPVRSETMDPIDNPLSDGVDAASAPFEMSLGWSYEMEIEQAMSWMEYQNDCADWAAWRGDGEEAAFRQACAEDWLDTANYYLGTGE